MTKAVIKQIESSEKFVRWAVTQKGRKTGYVYFTSDDGHIGKIDWQDYLLYVLIKG